jgi:F420-dependent oxidoreductase-like protein
MHALGLDIFGEVSKGALVRFSRRIALSARRLVCYTVDPGRVVRERLRFGIVTDQILPWRTLVERWRYFESLGFDSLWDSDHFIQSSWSEYPNLEAWTVLAGLAALTERIRIGVLVSSNTFRHPALLAKQAVTVDHISNGRLELGLGAGWFEREHTMFGVDFPAPAERVARFREAVVVVDQLLRNDESSYAGQYYGLRQARFRPRPIQQPRPPLVLAGHQPRMLRIAAEYADTWNSFGTADEMRARNQRLDEYCAGLGRDPGTLRRSFYAGWSMTPSPLASVEAFHDVIGRYREAGVEEFLLDRAPSDDFSVLERIAIEAIPAVRGGSA